MRYVKAWVQKVQSIFLHFTYILPTNINSVITLIFINSYRTSLDLSLVHTVGTLDDMALYNQELC